MEVVVTTGAIRRAKLQSNRHHRETNTQLFTGRMSFLSPNQQCQSTDGIAVHIIRICITVKHFDFYAGTSYYCKISIIRALILF